MNYNITKSGGSPAYLQLYMQLRRDIVAGVYPAGSRLPSKRLLSQELGLSVITVEHAYVLLCEEGYAEARERSGFFAVYREDTPFHPPAEAAAAAPPQRHGQVDFPFSVWARTMRRVISERGEALLEKSPNNGCAELREAIAAYLARSRGIHVKPGQIVIGSGAEYLYSLIVQTVGRSRIFALENPSYEKIRSVYTANGVKCDMLKLGADGILTPELRRSGATVLHVTPFHSFPSGVTATASKRREYIRWAEERRGYIVEDDFDSEFTISTKAEDTLFSLEGGSRVIYMNTFSRTIAPAMRIGYMLLPETLQEEFRSRVGFYSCTVPVFEQYVLAEFIRSGDFERHINRVRRRRRRAEEETNHA